VAYQQDYIFRHLERFGYNT